MTSPPLTPPLDARTLAPIVERALGCEAVLGEWSTTPLRVSLGLSTGGVFRVAGSSSSGAWSVVLKIVRPPSGTRHDAAARDPQHFAYWKREPLLYAEGVLDGLPRGFAAPCCFAVEERGPDEVWLWLEHVEDVFGPRWPRERYLLAARHLGTLSGAYLNRRGDPGSEQTPTIGRLSGHAWLHDRYFRVRFEQTERAGGWPLFASAETWRHPPIADAGFPPQTGARLLALWDRHAALVDRLYALPATFRHGDTHRDNLIARRTPKGDDLTVAIDWANAGMGAVGLDLLDLTLGGLSDLAREPEEVIGLADDLFTRYAGGLVDAAGGGLDGLVPDARRGYVIGTALAGASRLQWRLGRVLDGVETDARTLRAEAVKAHAILALAVESETFV